eukprot:12705192-Ditylum_brightwellii.AAC.1
MEFTLLWKTYNSLDLCMVVMPIDLKVGPFLMDLFDTLATEITIVVLSLTLLKVKVLPEGMNITDQDMDMKKFVI